MDKQVEYAQGFIFKEPREGAPEFVKGKMSIKVADALEYLKKYHETGEEWLNFDLTSQKADPAKWSAAKDDWKPSDYKPQVVKESQENNSFDSFGQVDYPTDDVDPTQIPF